MLVKNPNKLPKTNQSPITEQDDGAPINKPSNFLVNKANVKVHLTVDNTALRLHPSLLHRDRTTTKPEESISLIDCSRLNYPLLDRHEDTVRAKIEHVTLEQSTTETYIQYYSTMLVLFETPAGYSLFKVSLWKACVRRL